MDDIKNIPSRIVAAMRALLDEARVPAAKRESPGDGYSISVGQDKTIDGGHWEKQPDGSYGWTLQVSLTEDARMFKGPHLIVFAYSGSNFRVGSISMPMEWTAQERHILDLAHLGRMLDERSRLNEAIAELRKKLGHAS